MLLFQAGGLGSLKYPLLSDFKKTIARDYGVLVEAGGVALRYVCQISFHCYTVVPTFFTTCQAKMWLLPTRLLCIKFAKTFHVCE